MYTPKKIINKLYNLLENFHKYSNKVNLEYMIDGGTLLGAVRHNAIIPWDDDVDVCVINTKENRNKLERIPLMLEKNNIQSIKNDDGFKIFFKNDTKIRLNPWVEHMKSIKKKYPHLKGRKNITLKASQNYTKNSRYNKLYHNYNYPFLDILLIDIKNNRSYYSKDEHKNKYKWPRCFHYTNDMFPRRLYTLGKLKVYGPNKPLKYLNKCYLLWRKQGKINYTHKNEKIMKTKYIKINTNKNYDKYL